MDAPLPSDGPSITVSVHGRTDIGRAREHNEDALLAADFATLTPLEQFPAVVRSASDAPGALLMVADGMGGAASGEVASAMAVNVVLEAVRDGQLTATPWNAELFAAMLRTVIEAANQRIHAHASTTTAHRGMGTTATLAISVGSTLYVAQVGDSRAYLVRDGIAEQLTKDQSLIQKLVDEGELTREEAERSERRNIILQALGPEALVRVDVTHQRLRRGDTVVVCTDGLSGLVSAAEIAQATMESPDLGALCERLIAAANDAGGYDNITVLAARFDGDALADPVADDEVGYRPVGGDATPLWRTTPTEALSRILTPASVPTADSAPRRAMPPRRVGPVYALLAVAVVLLAVLVVLRIM